MITFQDLTLHDRELITSYTYPSNNRNCDFSFSNLCSWRFLYNTRYAIVDDFLVFKFTAGDTVAFMMPVGEGNYRKVILRLMENAKSENHPFCILGCPEDMKNKLEHEMPGMFHFESEREYADYIYLRESLVTLSGKKLQSKRNHINKFKKEYGYEYLPITPDNVDECLRLEAEWCKVNNCDEQEGTGNERRAIEYALKNFEALGLTGGMLCIMGKIVAFTFGTPINKDTFGIHVEKADTSIDGTYPMINNEFAKRIPEQYMYINREEDLGIEGLRKAKLSYNPAIILEKYSVQLKSEL